MPKLNPEPLKAAIAAYRKNRETAGKYAKLREELIVEVENFMKDGDPDDPKRIHEISGFKMQVEIIPNRIEKLNEQLPPLTEAIIAEVDKLRSLLAAEGDKERVEFLQRVEAMMQPIVAPLEHESGVEGIAKRVTAVNLFPYMAIHHSRETIAPNHRIEGYHEGESRDRAAMEYAAEILKIYEAWEQRGGAFTSERTRKQLGMKL